MPNGAKIVVDHASKLFLEGTVVAFRNVELNIRSNEVLTIVGPSGCGKTTLLRCIGGLLTPSSGQVLIDGEPIRSPRQGVAIVFQHFGLLPWKTVIGNVAFGLKIAGAPRQLIAERLDHYIRLVGLGGCPDTRGSSGRVASSPRSRTQNNDLYYSLHRRGHCFRRSSSCNGF